MMQKDDRSEFWSEFWWSSITGPNKVVADVAEGLISRSKILLIVPANLPWRHQMRIAIEDRIHMLTGSSDMTVTVIDADDEWDQKQEPGRFLLQHCGTSSAAHGFREKSGVSIQDYMVVNGVLRNTIVWVKGLGVDQANKWLQFCRGFHGNTAEDGLFILEIHGNMENREMRGVQTVDLAEEVRMYDVQLFNSFIVDEINRYNANWKSYAAVLAAHLCGTDAEVSQRFLQDTDLTLEEPLQGLIRVAELSGLEKRGAGTDSGHVLSLVRQRQTEKVERRIWSAQLQILFPLIEMERLQVVQAIRSELEACIHQETIEQFGQPLTSPEDVELGTMDYLLSHIVDGRTALIVQDQTLRDRVHFLRNCRNALAHGSCCTKEQVAELLGHSCTSVS
jgi:hypothetical protein